MQSDCEICGGSGIIRLPVRGKLFASVDNVPKTLPIREYSCPECGYKIPQDRIMVVEAQEIILDEEAVKFPDYLAHVKGSITHRMAEHLFKENQISFRDVPISKDEYPRYLKSRCIRGTLGVISPRMVATFEERVRERQALVANAVVAEAVEQIRNWGASYRWSEIEKHIAIRFLFEALHKIEKSPAIVPDSSPAKNGTKKE